MMFYRGVKWILFIHYLILCLKIKLQYRAINNKADKNFVKTDKIAFLPSCLINVTII
ncbi:MAG: hypothetical protein ACJA1H_000762 [Glaciecola sp.]|jgi:hypothetical protein